MLQLDAIISLGLILIVIGGAVFLAIRLLLCTAPKNQRIFPLVLANPPRDELPLSGNKVPIQPQDGAQLSDAFLVIQAGRKLLSLNSQTRQLYHLQEREIPNLERLARRTRPPEAFLSLCAEEGQGQFVLDGRVIEGTSRRLETLAGDQILVSLHYPDINSETGDSYSALPGKSLQTLSNITQSISANLDLKSTIQAILTNLEKIVPVDTMEISLPGANDNNLTTYRLTGDSGAERRMEHSWGNLISNAYNYTPENGQVTVRVKPMGETIQIDVEDNGIGIPPADHGQVFERFSRGEDPLVLETAGTGLGLSIVKNLGEMHHGVIWLSSTGEPGKGSVFSFTLPLHQIID
ncbi:MAG TPA: ATP-binding protein [Anaerolineaceae bacterium]